MDNATKGRMLRYAQIVFLQELGKATEGDVVEKEAIIGELGRSHEEIMVCVAQLLIDKILQ